MTQESNPEIIKVEGNIIETFPAHFERPRGHKNRAATETIATANGKITVRHNSRLFSAFDKDVLLAAFALAQRRQERRFRAVLSDFARVMRINPFGKNLVKIRESLNELAMTPAEFTESWRDAQSRRYTSEAVTSFIAYRMVARREIVESKLSPKEIRDGSWIAIPDLFYDSIENGYFRYIAADVYFSLPSGIVRAAYLYFEKRLGVKEHYEEKITSALENIIKRPTTPKDIKNFKYRTIAKLSSVFNFNKKKLKKGMIAVSRRVLFSGAAATEAATSSMKKTLVIARNEVTKQSPDSGDCHGRPDVHRGSLAMTNRDGDAAAKAATEAPSAGAVADEAIAGAAITAADVAEPPAENFVPCTAISGSPDSPEIPPPPNRVELRSKVPRSEGGDGSAPPLVSVKLPATTGSRASFSTSPAAGRARKKLTPRGEYILERACVFCNRDDDYFKNVVRKYIFLRGPDPVAAAISDTRDTNAKSRDRYFIHLLKNL